ncbi:MAG: chloride channel protein [Deltaproteobacteria bacterium]|nr:chloride channel protein [Deltaproteobacteria bacterium]
MKHFFNKIPIKPHFKPAIGGLFVGIIGLFVPQALGGGYGYIQLAILGKLSIGLMIGIILFKILSTSFTISSGGSGGVFGPSIFIGAMIGGVIGGLGQKLFPEVVINPGAFVLVGMAGFFAGVAHAPIGSLLMVCEMTGNYGLLAPLMLVSAISILLNRRVSLYEKQEKNRFASKAHADEMRVNILSEIPVEDVYEKDKKLVKLKEYMTFSELRKVITETNLDYFPVVDDDNRLKGILSLRDLRTVLFEDSLKDLVVVGELRLMKKRSQRENQLDR